MPQAKILNTISGPKIQCQATGLPLDSAFSFKGLYFLNYIVALVYFLQKAKDDKSKDKVIQEISELSKLDKEKLLDLASKPENAKLVYDLPKEGRVHPADILESIESKKKEKISSPKKPAVEFFVYVIPQLEGESIKSFEVLKGENLTYDMGVYSGDVIVEEGKNLRALLFQEPKSLDENHNFAKAFSVLEQDVPALYGDVVVVSSKKLPFLLTMDDKMNEELESLEVKEKAKAKKKEAAPKKEKEKKEKAPKKEKKKKEEEKEEVKVVVATIEDMLPSTPKKKRKAPSPKAKKAKDDSPKKPKAPKSPKKPKKEKKEEEEDAQKKE